MKEEDYIYIFVKTFLFFDRFVKAFNLRNVNFSFSKSDFCYNEEEKKKNKKKNPSWAPISARPNGMGHLVLV